MGLKLAWELHWQTKDHTRLWYYEPIQNVKFLLVSWRLAGSEFVRETIRENFPSTSEITKWGKSHFIRLPDQYVPPLLENQTKVILSIADPRDVAAHIQYWRGGQHIHPEDEWGFDILDERWKGVRFLDTNLQKMIEMLEFYHRTFGKNVLILRYEDAVNNRSHFLNQVSEFLREDPLNVDDKEKYKPEVSICKPIGIYPTRYNPEEIDQHMQKYIGFYKRWNY